MEQDILQNKTSLSAEELKDKVKGIIYGTAIGDGVGLATEFMGKEQAQILYGNGPIKFGSAKGHEVWRDAHRSRWFENDFTDDTDQMLLIVQSLLADKGDLNPVNFAYRINEWRKIGFPELDNKLPNGIGYTVGSTFSHENFLSDPCRASYDVWNEERKLAANGAVMRTGGVGISSFWNEGQVVENSMMAAKVTHADPRSVTSAVIVSVIISRLLRGSMKSVSDPLSENENQSHILDLIQIGSTDDRSYLERFKSHDHPEPKQLQTSIYRSLQRQVRRFAALVTGKPMNPRYEIDFNLPEYPDVDENRHQNPAPIRPNIKKMDEFGSDDDMISLCRNVVDKYKFLLEAHPLCPSDQNDSSEEKDETAKKTVSCEGKWVNQLYAHCFPDSLSSLKLAERGKIGYTFKCLGAAVYAATRKKPEDMSSQHFYKHLITELTLEGGDADTNCAVAGALLGCRLGKSGLPKAWLEGLRHKDFLENISNQVYEMLLQRVTESI